MTETQIEEEIRTWAYDPVSYEPQQDFDLLLATQPRDLYLELAADAACPKQSYFLAVLYLIVGDAVRTGYQTQSRRFIEAFLHQGRSQGSISLDIWANQAEELMAEPSKFDYDLWCNGGRARKPVT